MQRHKRLNRGNHKELVEKKQNRYVVTDGMLEGGGGECQENLECPRITRNEVNTRHEDAGMFNSPHLHLKS